MNIVSIPAKMRVDLDDSDVKVAGTHSEEQPVQYKGRRITYEFTGKDWTNENPGEAVNLSIERYCGV